MAISLPLHEMTLADKLQVMEALWDDLSRDSESVVSPDWHAEILQERTDGVDQGKDSFIDWETAKAELRRRVA